MHYDPSLPRILFQHKSFAEWRAFSNFHYKDMYWKGFICPTSEHAYQAEKAANQLGFEWVMASTGPGEARRRGQVIIPKDNWNEIKVSVMKQVIDVKFPIDANDSCTQLLLKSGMRELVEYAPWEKYDFGAFWGVDDNNRGLNWLGKVLMERRYELFQAGLT